VSQELPWVKLRGESANGRVAEVPTSHPLNVKYKFNDWEWPELYLSSNGQSIDDANHGTIPVLEFSGRTVNYRP
jgi:hypothetical protein